MHTNSVSKQHAHARNYFTQTDYSTLILGVFPWDQIAHVGFDVRRDLKLFGGVSREITFEVFQPMSLAM